MTSSTTLSSDTPVTSSFLFNDSRFIIQDITPYFSYFGDNDNVTASDVVELSILEFIEAYFHFFGSNSTNIDVIVLKYIGNGSHFTIKPIANHNYFQSIIFRQACCFSSYKGNNMPYHQVSIQLANCDCQHDAYNINIENMDCNYKNKNKNNTVCPGYAFEFGVISLSKSKYFHTFEKKFSRINDSERGVSVRNIIEKFEAKYSMKIGCHYIKFVHDWGKYYKCLFYDNVIYDPQIIYNNYDNIHNEIYCFKKYDCIDMLIDANYNLLFIKNKRQLVKTISLKENHYYYPIFAPIGCDCNDSQGFDFQFWHSIGDFTI